MCFVVVENSVVWNQRELKQGCFGKPGSSALE